MAEKCCVTTAMSMWADIIAGVGAHAGE